ncbi:MAG TPA: hypothetical protein VKG45_11555 [Actinomycetes bacterium]|nr:hypothetical protein [Actinomycetes bacterium]
MPCPDEGTLRAWLDDEPSAAGAGEHLAGCAGCQDAVARLRLDARTAAHAVQLLHPAVEPDAEAVEVALEHATARSRLRAAVAPAGARAAATTVLPPADGAAAATPPRRRRGTPRARLGAAAAAAALALVAVVATPAGRGAAAAFLEQFRSDRFQPIEVDPAQAEQAFEQLDQLGTVSGDLQGAQPRPVASLAEASRRVGFTVRTPAPASLPAGVGGDPEIMVSPAHEVRFTFDLAKARRSLERDGRAGVELPARFDGASLVVSIPAGVVLVYGEQDLTRPGMLVGQAGRLRVSAEGVSLGELREFLLDLPGLSDATRRQLRAIDDWRTTLPLPIPAGQVRWSRSTVNGVEALVLAQPGIGAGLLWQQDGRIYGVAGNLPVQEVRGVAERLR